MAITKVQGAQSAGGVNAATIAISAATAGNTLITFMSQTGLNTPTATGFTINGTSAVYNTSLSSIWVGTKIATGGETAATWVAGSGGTVHGVTCIEFAGAASVVTLDGSPVAVNNTASAATNSLTYTTSVPGSVVVMGTGSDTSTGTISAWTGTNVATNVGTAAARCFGGSFITTSTISSTFTCSWATAHVSGMLGVALQPPSTAGSKPSIYVSREAQNRASRW